MSRASRAAARATDVALAVAPRACVRAFAAYELRRSQSALALVDDLVGPGDVVVDVGAHRGVFTHRLAGLVGASGRVHSFEPNPDPWRVLTAVQRKQPQVTLHHLALSDHAGTAVLNRPYVDGSRVDAMSSIEDRGEGGVAGPAQVDPVEVRVDSLDAVLGSLRPPPARVGFVKIDVEGHELAVLRGAAETVRAHRPSVLVEIEQRHTTHDVAETFAWFTDRGYAGWFRASDRLRPLEEFDVRRHQTDLLPADLIRGRPAAGYVTDFVFRPHHDG